MKTLTPAQARRIVVAAQGFAGGRPAGGVDVRHLHRVLAAVGAIQIDSVNVVARAHHLTLFARLGARYDRDLPWRALQEHRTLFEYWGHEASFLPVEDWSLFRHRMDAVRPWRAVERIRSEHPGYLDAVLAEVHQRGPLSAGGLSDPGPSRREAWWGWNEGKLALEWLFATGKVTVAERRNFTRFYDIPERVIPEAHLAAEPVPRDEAHRALLTRAARACGVATAKDLVDYYRLPLREGRAAVAGLVASGILEEVAVDGWRESALLYPEARVPRKVAARSLLCPFDSLVWNRERTERIFGFRYRVEIYVPQAKRRYGYYVFPFLLGDALVARVDLKADRAAGVLRVPGAFGEAGVGREGVAGPLADELTEMARWLGLDEVAVARRGDLAAPLAAALRGRR
jgi:uncharacterized protein YcaQ